MDTVMFGGLYAFTGIDIYTREADIPASPGPECRLRLCLPGSGR